MEPRGHELGGRGYLAEKLRERGVSRRQAVRILNLIFAEMKQTLARGRPVEFPCGTLRRVRKVSRHWEIIGDEPMRPNIPQTYYLYG